MNDSFVTVPLRHDESAFPLGMITYSQFSVAYISYSNPDLKPIELSDGHRYEKVPLQGSDVSAVENGE